MQEMMDMNEELLWSTVIWGLWYRRGDICIQNLVRISSFNYALLFVLHT